MPEISNINYFNVKQIRFAKNIMPKHMFLNLATKKIEIGKLICQFSSRHSV